MNTAVKLGAFGAALAAVFAGAYGIGNAVGPADAPRPPVHDTRDPGKAPEDVEGSGGHGGHG